MKQFHLTSWPVNGVLPYATPLLLMRKKISDIHTQASNGHPILVHCSAGVRRTGTFIALDIALEQADREGAIDIAGIVNRLRQQRMKMVQTEVLTL